MKVQKYDDLLKSESLPILQLISFIDVLFVLLIFFMVTTNFSDIKAGVNIVLPKTTAGDVPVGRDIVVSVSKDGVIYLNSDKTTYDNLEEKIAQKVKLLRKTAVIIQADEKTEHGIVVKIMAAAKRAGADNINIATDEEK